MKWSLIYLLSLLGVTVLICPAVADCPADEGKEVTSGNIVYTVKCGQTVYSNQIRRVEATSFQACADACAAEPKCKQSVFNPTRKSCDLKDGGSLTAAPSGQPYHALVFSRDKSKDPPPQNPPAQNPPAQNAPAQNAPAQNAPAQSPVVQNPPAQNPPAQQPMGGSNTGGSGNQQQPSTPPLGSTTPQGNGQGTKPPTVGAANLASYECPRDDGKPYTSKNGITYKFLCGFGHASGHLQTVSSPSITDCAETCAQRSDCGSLDYNAASAQCALKGPGSPTSANSNYNAFYPMGCPSPRKAIPDSKPQITEDISCPMNDNKIFMGTDGTWYHLQCCTDGSGVSLLMPAYQASSHADCIERCTKTKDCKSVTYAPGITSSENCKLYGHGHFSSLDSSDTYYAFVTDPPTEKPKLSNGTACATECPDADGQLYKGVSGENYLISCNKRHGTDYLKIDRRENLSGCLGACSAMPDCHSADYEPRTKKCFYSNNHNSPKIDAEAFQSFHTLGCSGACEGCQKDCDVAKSKLGPDEAGCMEGHGQLFQAGSEFFRMVCAHCFESSDKSSRLPTSLKQTKPSKCMDECAANPNCHGTNWNGPGFGCTFHQASSASNTVKLLEDAHCDAMIPLGRSHSSIGDQIEHPSPINTKRYDGGHH